MKVGRRTATSTRCRTDDERLVAVDAITIWQEPRHEGARRVAAGVDLDLCYNPSNERLHNAAEPGRVDDGKRARLSNSPFFGHAERTTPTFKSRCFASLRGHLRLQWLHVLFFGIVKPTFSPPAALCARAGRIKEGETVPWWAERRAKAKKRPRSGHGRAGDELSHFAPRVLPSAHKWQTCSMPADMCQVARPVACSRCTQCTDCQGRRTGAFLRMSADIMPCI